MLWGGDLEKIILKSHLENKFGRLAGDVRNRRRKGKGGVPSPERSAV